MVEVPIDDRVGDGGGHSDQMEHRKHHLVHGVIHLEPDQNERCMTKLRYYII